MIAAVACARASTFDVSITSVALTGLQRCVDWKTSCQGTDNLPTTPGITDGGCFTVYSLAHLTVGRYTKSKGCMLTAQHCMPSTAPAPVRPLHLKFAKQFLCNDISKSRTNRGLRQPAKRQRAHAAADQRSINSVRPRSSSGRSRTQQLLDQDRRSNGAAADSGEPGKRVVIVGGGWAGKTKCVMHSLMNMCRGQSSNCIIQSHNQ